MGVTEKILKSGYWQKGLYSLLLQIQTNYSALLAKLDADSTVNDTDYDSLLDVATPIVGDVYNANIKPNGMLLGDVITLCSGWRINFNDLMDKLAADSGVNGTAVYLALKFASGTYLIDVSNAEAKKLGIHQGGFVEFLDQFIAVFNAALLLLDADSGVADTNYASLYFIGDVVEASSSSSSSRSSSSSSRSSSSSSSSSSSCRSSSSSSSSCSSSSSSSSRSSSSSSRSSSSSSSSSRSSSSSSSSRSSSSSSSSSRSSSSSSSKSSSSSSSKSSSSSSKSSSSSSSSSQSIG